MIEVEGNKLQLSQSEKTTKHPFRERLSCVLENVVNHFRVSPQLHLLDLGVLSLATAIVIAYNERQDIFLMSTYLSVVNTIYNEFKAFNNLGNYKRVRSELIKHGYDERIIRPMTNTLCDRNAARCAAIDAGFEQEVTQYYKEIGRNGSFPQLC